MTAINEFFGSFVGKTCEVECEELAKDNVLRTTKDGSRFDPDGKICFFSSAQTAKFVIFEIIDENLLMVVESVHFVSNVQNMPMLVVLASSGIIRPLRPKKSKFHAPAYVCL